MKLITPLNRQINQRDNQNRAIVNVSGQTEAFGVIRVRCRFVPVQGGTDTGWYELSLSGSSYRGKPVVVGGWYLLVVEGSNVLGDVIETTTLERIGVGEVFLVAGHSVAHGDTNPIPGSSSDRISAIPLPGEPYAKPYGDTASASDLPALQFVQYGDGVRPAPFGSSPYFWSKFAEILSDRINVPVLVMNAGFGGSSLQHWALSSQGQPFQHGFIRSDIGMPYANVRHALSKYVRQTGIRAILSDHGQNDYDSRDELTILTNYQTWVTQARTDLGYAPLAVLVNRQTPYITMPNVEDGVWIRRVQEQMTTFTHCFAGPDYDSLSITDRYDHIHLTPAGQYKAAQLWANAVSDSFLGVSMPYQPETAMVDRSGASLVGATKPASTNKTVYISLFVSLLVATVGVLIWRKAKPFINKQKHAWL